MKTCWLALLLSLPLLFGLTPRALAAMPPGNPPPASALQPQNPNPSAAPQVLLPDPRQLVRDVFNQAIVDLLKNIADSLHQVIAGVLDSPLNVITRTPADASYGNPTVQSLWSTVRNVANAALAVVTLAGAFNLVVHDRTGSPYHEAMELLPRLVLGFLLVNTSLSWGRLIIDANNALCQGLGQATLPGWQSTDAGSQLLAQVVAALIYLITGLLLLIQSLMRLALIDLLLAVAPIALLCWVLPQTQSWARLWSSTFIGAVATQFVQVLALKLGGSLMTYLAAPTSNATLMTIFLAIALLALTLKIPSLMRGQLGDGLGFARYFAYRQMAHSLETRGGGGSE